MLRATKGYSQSTHEGLRFAFEQRSRAVVCDLVLWLGPRANLRRTFDQAREVAPGVMEHLNGDWEVGWQVGRDTAPVALRTWVLTVESTTQVESALACVDAAFAFSIEPEC